jgi:hypothetical protein
MRKIVVALIFVAVVSTGAFAQLMFGLSGALHMDEKLTGREINARFKSGEGIFYGGFAEFVGKNFGVGITGNVSSYNGDLNGSYTYNNVPYFFTLTNTDFRDYDFTLYLSYHIFGGRAFLDPFGEFGPGVIATGFAHESKSIFESTYVPWDSSFIAASYYWYAALGLGVNLGPIGIFGKFSFNYPIKKAFEANFKENDENGVPTGLSGSTKIGPYGYDSVLFPSGYLPKYRFTAGIKVIL